MIIINPKDAPNSCSGKAQFAPNVDFRRDSIPAKTAKSLVVPPSLREVPIGNRAEPLMPDLSSGAVGGIFAGAFVISALLVFIFWFFSRPKMINGGVATITK